MQVIYIAGPYRAATAEGVRLNIATARKVGTLAALKGWSPLIPHSNTGELDGVLPLDDDWWLAATLELMCRCDAVLLCPGWQLSEGTLAEIATAERMGLPVYYTDADLPEAAWRHGTNDNQAAGVAI